MVKREGIFVFILFLVVLSVFVYAVNPYGEPILEAKKIPSSLGYHELRLITNSSDGYSVDANENGIIDVAESVLGGGAYWLPAVLGVYYMGNAGIGEDDPQRKLHISASQDANIRLQDTDASDGTAAYIEFYNGTDRIGTIGLPGDTEDYLVIATEKGKDIVLMPYDGGNVGIGTTEPNEKLTVHTNVPGGDPNSPVYAMSIDVGTFGNLANAQNSYYFRVRDLGAGPTGTTRFYIRGDGNVGIGTTTPAGKLDVNGTICIKGNCISDWSGTGGADSDWIINGNNMSSGVSGNVGIGTTSPELPLHVYSSTTNPAMFETDGSVNSVVNIKNPSTVNNGGQRAVNFMDSGQAVGQIQVLNTNPYVSGKANMRFGTSGNSRMTIDENGNVGIGTTSPLYTLHIKPSTGNGSFAVGRNGSIHLEDATAATDSAIFNDATDSSNIKFRVHTGSALVQAMTIDTTGNVGIGTTNPGYKLDVNGTTNSKEICINGDCKNSWPVQPLSMQMNYAPVHEYPFGGYTDPYLRDSSYPYPYITLSNAIDKFGIDPANNTATKWFTIGYNYWQPYDQSKKVSMFIEMGRRGGPI